MKFRKITLALVLLVPILPLSAAPENAREAMLAQAQSRLHNYAAQLTPIYQSADWLIGLPTISISHLQGLDSRRSYEQQLSLNLPFKSPAMHRLDEALKPLNQQLIVQQSRLQQLYLSGLLRQYWWQQQLADTELQQLQHKQQLLQQLLERQKALSLSGEAPTSQLLVLQRELLDLQLAMLTPKQQRASAAEALRRLTGLEQLPSLDESSRLLPQDDGINNPLWQLASIQLQRQKLLGKTMAEGDTTPWILSVNAKNTATPGMEEQAIGLALDIPLPTSSGLSQQEVGTLVEQQLQLEQQQQQLMLQTKLQLDELRQQLAQLQQQQLLLQQSLTLSQQLTASLAATKQQGLPQYQAWLRSYVDTLDTESRLALNQLAQSQLHSKQLQALGVTL
ncbi:metal transporter [Shewanella yunxiaonensis]|uniref:Metal transporter n=1 Tax=Shewanella yunxiaonensis TaxID=2829809 RepID=A0ABX7YUG5_9GAMM|nr:metal transporter [Shewanella yunxiaonensis]QUN06005.1 metal transporter [Shewanella yunxiaonensis]